MTATRTRTRPCARACWPCCSCGSLAFRSQSREHLCRISHVTPHPAVLPRRAALTRRKRKVQLVLSFDACTQSDDAAGGGARRALAGQPGVPVHHRCASCSLARSCSLVGVSNQAGSVLTSVFDNICPWLKRSNLAPFAGCYASRHCWTESYRPSFYYYEPVALLRRVALVAVSALVSGVGPFRWLAAVLLGPRLLECSVSCRSTTVVSPCRVPPVGHAGCRLTPLRFCH